MGRRSNYAARMDVKIQLKKEEYALGTGQITNDAAVKNAQIESSKEECVSGMGQREEAMQ